MTFRIGRRALTDDDPVGLLLACHDRIRTFARLARAVAEADVAPAQRAEAAADVVRYFTHALPLHVEDEERSIAPRLRGRDPAVDAALDRMRADHDAHGAPLAALVAACRAIAAAPAEHAVRAAGLAAVAAALIADFDAHLACEEAVILPALAALPDGDRAAVRAEMSARRSGTVGG